MAINVQITSNISGRMSQRAAALKLSVEKRIRNYAAEITFDLIDKTPIRTGQARSNWRVSTVEADYTYTQFPYDPIIKEGIPQYDAINAAFDTAFTEIEKFQIGMKIYITNGAPYINRLNDGYSPQAPPLYIQDVIAAHSSDIHHSTLASFG